MWGLGFGVGLRLWGPWLQGSVVKGLLDFGLRGQT